MAFVKLDCGILNSTLWVEKDARDVFITALLMAQPREFERPTPQLEPDSLKETGWIVPPGWYGFVPAAGVGIIRMTGLPTDVGMEALRKLGSPEPDSRSQEFEGRRLVRVNGGYLVLNFMRYREKDHTAAERMRRLRARKRDASQSSVTPVALRNVTAGDARVTDSREQRTHYRDRTEERTAPANPLLAGRRVDMEREVLAMIGEIATLTGDDPVEVMATASGYKGQTTTKLNPATMSDDRLANTWRDLKSDLTKLRAEKGRKDGTAVRG